MKTLGSAIFDLFDLSSDGMIVTDPDGTIHRANRAIAQLLQIDVARLLDTPLSQYIAADSRVQFSSLLESVQDSLQPFESRVQLMASKGVIVEASLTGASQFQEDGSLRQISWLIRKTGHGSVLPGDSNDHAGNEDLRNDVHSLQRRFKLLAEASRTFAEASLDLDAVLDAVGRSISKAIGDICVIRLLSKDEHWLNAVSVHHPDPETERMAREVNAMFSQPATKGPAGRVLETGQPLLMPYIDQELIRTTIKTEYLPYFDRTGLHSLLMVPLRVRGRVIGTLGISRDTPDNPYTLDDQTLLQDLADRAAMAVDNARLYSAVHDELIERRRFEARYRLVTLATNDAVWDWDLVANTIWRNEAVQTLFGYSPEDVGSDIDWWYRHIHPDDRESVITSVDAALQGHSPYWAQEYRFCRVDGSYAYILDRGYVMHDEGKPLRMIGAMIDITQRKLAEQALLESEQKHRSLLENIPDVTWTVDETGMLWFVSTNIERVCGYQHETLSRNLRENRTLYVHPNDGRLVARAFMALFHRGEPYDVEYRLRRPDGSWIWVHDRATVTYERDGVRFADGLFSDITERKQAQAALLLFRNLIDQSTDALFVTSPSDGRILDVNESACVNLGYTREELLSMTILDIENTLPTEETLRTHIEDLKAHGSLILEGEHRTKDGRVFPVEVSVKYVVIDEREFLVAVVRDITERKHTQEALIRAHDMLVKRLDERTSEVLEMMAQLEQARSSQERFVADASHDLRTPLTIVRAELELLRQRPEHDTRTREALDRISTESKRIDQLASDLLLLATLGAANFDETIQTTQISDVILDSIADIERARPTHTVVWDIDFRDVVVCPCSRQSMQRALASVLDNAIRFSPDRGVVTVTLQSSESAVIIEVIDRGCGITPEDLPHVFDRFYRGDRSRTTAGSGLGLTIAKEIIDLHGGTIHIESTLEAGTSVIITLPLE